MLHVLSARVVRPHVLWLRFSDGAEGEADLAPELEGPVFAPLREPAAFERAVVDPELRTVVWPNGADFAPEFLRGLIRVRVSNRDDG
jgi:hypothetical protein